MELILWRHAEAEDGVGKPDDERDLTKKGVRQAERMAEWLRPRLEGDWRVLVGPSHRTQQTVAPLGWKFETTREVGTGADAERVLRAAGWPHMDRVIVVGHQPTLGQVAAEIMGGRGDVTFRKGAVWWFVTRVRAGEEGIVLKTVIDPETLD